MDSLLQAPGSVSYVVVAVFTLVLVLMLFYHIYGNFRPKLEHRKFDNHRRRTPTINASLGSDMHTSIVSEVRYSNRMKTEENPSADWLVISSSDQESDSPPHLVDDEGAYSDDAEDIDESYELQGLVEENEADVEVQTEDDVEIQTEADVEVQMEADSEVQIEANGEVQIEANGEEQAEEPVEEYEKDTWTPKTEYHTPKRAPEHDEEAIERRRSMNEIEDHVCIKMLKPGNQISINGVQVRRFMEDEQIPFADGYFHYHGENGEGRMFGIFNALRPGTFETDFENQLTVGLIFAIDTTAYQHDLADAYQSMVHFAYKAAVEFDAVLLDGHGSTICKQYVNNQLNKFHSARLEHLSEVAAAS